ncbi:unnamed protein product [Adineta ricciae]|uniref:Uncharacterized protein n=1 Tax=Adineta ricciae TaxID=249248 RepID=A0A814BZ00_ADIRI|nr:unnamed protein product [Adineta ricciae]CAF1049116.1 unnamed protein product [Adineta ricciae]
MNQHSAFLRPHHGKTNNSLSSNSSSSTSNDTDENSTIKNLIYKHITKGQQSTMTTTLNKGTMRGILGEVGNMTLSNKPMISKPKIIQQQSSFATIIESKSVVSVPPPAPPPVVIPSITTTTATTVVDEEVEEIISDYEDDEYVSDVPAEFDCDSGDRHNIITASEYVGEICKYWRELEERTPIRQNFLLNRREGTASPQNRAVLIDWLYQVHDRFKLLSDTFHMTVNFIDRYLQLVDVSKHDLQLIGSAALLLACKYEEMTIPGMNDFVYVSDNAYSKEDMKEMERRIISTLSYDLGRPLSINYLRRYSKIIQATDLEHTLGKYLLDLTFIDHSFSHLLPSYVAACASFLSRYLLAYKRVTPSTSMSLLVEHLWPAKFMLYHTGYTYEQLRQGIEQLGQLLIGQETAKLKSVHKKFSQSNMFSIAQHNCCKSAFVQIALTRLTK